MHNSQAQDTECCSSCRFYRLYKDLDQAWREVFSGSGAELCGFCRRYPKYEDHALENWCGEFVALAATPSDNEKQ